MAEQNIQVDDDLQLPLDLSKDKKAQSAAPADETIDELKKRVADNEAKAKAAIATAEAERSARMDMERRSVTSAQEVEQYKTQAQSAEQRAVVNAIEAATRESESAQRELEAAMNAADYASVGKVQAKIAKAAAQLVQYENMKAAMDQQASRQTVRIDQPQTRYVDPVEQFISAQNPRVATWVREHRDMVVQKGQGVDFSPAAWAAHYDALANGIAEGSDDYFRHLSDRVAPKAVQDDGYDDPPLQQRSIPRRAPVAAPVSRDVPNNGGQRQTSRTRLSAEEVEIARVSGMSAEQYAENKRVLLAEGKIGRTTH